MNIKNTLPKDIMIKIYKKLQTGQNTHDGGDRVGLINFKYQFSVFIILLSYLNYYYPNLNLLLFLFG